MFPELSFFSFPLSSSLLIMSYCILFSSNVCNLCVYSGCIFVYLIIFWAFSEKQMRHLNKSIYRMKWFLLCETLSMTIIVCDFVPLFRQTTQKNPNWWLVWFGYFALKWNNIAKERKKILCFGHFRLIITYSLVIRMYHPIHQLIVYMFVCGVRNNGDLLSGYK